MLVYIYTLEHPLTKEIRYVGKTKNPKQRFHNHCNKSHNVKSHKRNWINNLVSQGLRPKMDILDVVTENDWRFWERYWISQLKSWGISLVNHTDGGEGLSLGNNTSFKKGNTPWNKGKGVEKVPKGNRGKTEANIVNQFKKGGVPWNKQVSGYTTSKSKPVLQISLDGKIISEFINCKAASIAFDCNIENIRNVCAGRAKTARGFIWKYKI